MIKRYMLKYVGDGAVMLGIPARDILYEEARNYDLRYVLSRGLYVKIEVEDHEPQQTSGTSDTEKPD